MSREPGDRPRFFGRRNGKKLRQTALGLIETLLPRLALAVPEPGQQIDPAGLFAGPVTACWLEVGFGGGEHLAELAEAHPTIGMIGSEVFRNGVASLLGHIDQRGLGNIRLFADDVRLLLPSLPDSSLNRVFVLFPDPWPKTRHAERRFINPDNLDQLARVMADGGELRVASDDPIYVAWANAQLEAHPAFVRLQVTSDRAAVPADWPQTRYEVKCLSRRQPTFFRYSRRPRD